MELVITAALTVVAGAVDAITFLTMGHLFAALTTGNLLFLSFALVGEGQVPVARPAAALIAFACGAAATTWASRQFDSRGRGWLSVALISESVLLGAAGALVLWRHGTGSLTNDPDLVAIAIVSFAMGMRAVTMLLFGVAEMPTLLAQMSMVKLIAELAGRPHVHRGTDAVGQRVARTPLAATVGGLVLGGVAGTLMVPWGTGRALVVVGAVVLALSLAHLLMCRPLVSDGGT
ncbi:YoaK family protein [Streptomyces sp. NPDC056468]|uniref:YoaK family protein n=1 Tax=Streptomyces sp. NPDC056468 TaxID=3345830 RepID=UPI0036CF970E